MTLTADDLTSLVDRYDALGRFLFVGEAAELAGIPAGLQLQQRIADIAGTTLDELRSALAPSETGGVVGTVLKLGRSALGAIRGGASKAWAAAGRHTSLALGLASIGGLVLADVLEPDADVVQAETMGRMLAEQVDRLPPREKAEVLARWGEMYGQGGSSIPWGAILAVAGVFVAWKVLR